MHATPMAQPRPARPPTCSQCEPTIWQPGFWFSSSAPLRLGHAKYARATARTLGVMNLAAHELAGAMPLGKLVAAPHVAPEQRGELG